MEREKITLTISSIEGFSDVMNVSRNRSLHQIDNYINHLIAIRNLMKRFGVESVAAEQYIDSHRVHCMIKSSDCIIDRSALDAVTSQGSARYINSNHIPTGECVYFLTHPTRPDEIKIGYTKDFLARTGSMNSTFDGVSVKAVAIIITPEHAYMEKVLHRHFHFCKRDGEWFYAPPVLEWLKETIEGFDPTPYEVQQS